MFLLVWLSSKTTNGAILNAVAVDGGVYCSPISFFYKTYIYIYIYLLYIWYYFVLILMLSQGFDSASGWQLARIPLASFGLEVCTISNSLFIIHYPLFKKIKEKVIYYLTGTVQCLPDHLQGLLPWHSAPHNSQSSDYAPRSSSFRWYASFSFARFSLRSLFPPLFVSHQSLIFSQLHSGQARTKSQVLKSE